MAFGKRKPSLSRRLRRSCDTGRKSGFPPPFCAKSWECGPENMPRSIAELRSPSVQKLRADIARVCANPKNNPQTAEYCTRCSRDLSNLVATINAMSDPIFSDDVEGDSDEALAKAFKKLKIRSPRLSLKRGASNASSNASINVNASSDESLVKAFKQLKKLRSRSLSRLPGR